VVHKYHLVNLFCTHCTRIIELSAQIAGRTTHFVAPKADPCYSDEITLLKK
jgi:hypothetical protein